MTFFSPSWIALMIGNSRLHWAWGKGSELQHGWHTPHLKSEAIAHLVAHNFNFEIMLSDLPLGSDRPSLPHPFTDRDLYIASVVPDQTRQWQVFCPNATVMTLDDLPLMQTYPTLGIDRALAAYGCVVRSRAAALVIDAGTAMTLTGVDATLRFMGGAILPGVRLQLRSLGMNTANLPMIAIQNDEGWSFPPRWATQTETAMLSGVLYMLVSGLQGFVHDWCDRYPDSVLVLTGGDRHLIWTGLNEVNPALAARFQVTDTAVMDGMAIAINRIRQIK